MSYKARFPHPFVKWAGGKSQVLDEISKILPQKYDRYYEPFLGGGALFFHIRPGNALISDSNFELINAYTTIRDNLNQLIVELDALQKQILSRPLFEKYKKLDPKKLPQTNRAARFIFLNKTCYNGLWRVNRRGEFNVPIGKYRTMPKLSDKENLHETRRLLQRTHIICDDYGSVLAKAGKRDLIYLDPPYSKDSAQAFVSYTKESFSEADQRRLATKFRELDNRGCLLILSNSDTDFVRGLYSEYRDRTIKISAGRWINSVGSDRTGYSELLITNYVPTIETLSPWIR